MFILLKLQSNFSLFLTDFTEISFDTSTWWHAFCSSTISPRMFHKMKLFSSLVSSCAQQGHKWLRMQNQRPCTHHSKWIHSICHIYPVFSIGATLKIHNVYVWQPQAWIQQRISSKRGGGIFTNFPFLKINTLLVLFLGVLCPPEIWKREKGTRKCLLTEIPSVHRNPPAAPTLCHKEIRY